MDRSPPRTEPFRTQAEIDEYLAGDLIQCLECGKWFRQITGKHLRLVHELTPDEYRARWALPRLTPLAGRATREARSQVIRRQIESGALTYDHLPTATDAAREAGRPRKVPAQAAAQSERVRKLRPGDHSHLPPGAKRADGRDADRAREYQRGYREKQKSGGGYRY